MKFLVDMPLSPDLARWLRARDHDAVHAGEQGLSRAPDPLLLAEAREQQRIVVTADLDFPRLLALTYATGPGVILYRGGNFSDAEMISLMERVLGRYDEQELAHAIVVVDRNRLRRAPLPISRPR